MNTTPFDRRAFLRRAGVTAAATAAVAAGLPRPAAALDTELGPFFHGVASGDPLHDRVILWTRVTPRELEASIPVTWRVFADVDLTRQVASGTTTAERSRDWTVKVDPSGLSPFTTYYYLFEAYGVRSLVGRTKTAPAPGQSVDRLRFGVVSCSNLQGGYFNAYARVAERDDLDAVLHLGDYLYEYADGGYTSGEGEVEGERPIEPDGEMISVADYRLRYASYRLDPDLRRLHQVHPMIATWDDHETTNNSYKEGAQNHSPDEGDYQVRKRAAAQVYDEWMPMRVQAPGLIYRSFAYGDLADLVVLDTRIEGRDEPGGIGAYQGDLSDPAREMISQAQRDFVYGELSASQQRGTAWRIIPQQVMMMQLNVAGVPELPGPDTPNVVRDGGVALNGDAWDGYTAERSRLYDHIESDGITDLVVLTGDIHTSWAADLTRDPYDPTVYDPTGVSPLHRNIGVEYVTPSITSANFESLGVETSRALAVAVQAANPHIKMVDLTGHGYNVLDVTPERVQSDWFFVDTVLRPTDVETHHDSWFVEKGAHRVVQASAPSEPKNAAPAPAGEPAPSPTGTAGSSRGDDKADGAAFAAAPGELPSTGGGTVLTGLGLLAGAGVLRFAERRERVARESG